jgi:hypothetical protein
MGYINDGLCCELMDSLRMNSNMLIMTKDENNDEERSKEMMKSKIQ